MKTYPLRLVLLAGLSSTCVLAQTPAPRPASNDEKVVQLAAFEVFSQSIVSSLDEKREAKTISNFVTSDALGVLPDDTLGAALTRVPGVNVVNGNAVIRGIEGKFNAVQLDGSELPSAMTDFDTDIRLGRDDRAFDVDSIPVDVVESVEVLKSITPDRDADSVGGLVNVRTANAFRFKKPIYRYKVEGRYREQGKANGYGAYVTYASRLNAAGTAGLFLTASYRNEDLQNWWFQYSASGNPVDATGKVNVPLLSEIQPFEERINNRRLTLAGSLDFKLGDHTTLYVKPWINNEGIRQDQYRYRWVRLNSTVRQVFYDNLQSRTPVAGPTDFKQMDEFQFVRRLLERPGLYEHQYRVKAGGETKIAGGVIDYSYQFGESKNGGDEYLASWTTYDQNPNNAADRMRLSWRAIYDDGNKLLPTLEVYKLSPTFAPLSPRADRWGAFDYDLIEEIRYQNFDQREQSHVADLNFTREVGGVFPLTFKTGARLRAKSRYNRVEHVSWAPNMGPTGFGRNLSAASPEFADQHYGTFDAFDGRYAFLGPWIRVGPVWDFFAKSPVSNWVRNERGTYTVDAAKNYDADEAIYAGYAMGTFTRRNLTITAGVRVEATDVDYVWRASAIEPPDPRLPRLKDVKGGQEYVDGLPSVVAAYRLNENNVLRAAATKTLSRPDYARLVPYNTSAMREAWGGNFVNVTAFEIGNPKLTKQSATNYDLGYEYYYGRHRQNTLSLGLFRKEMDNFLLHVGFTRDVLVPADPVNPNSRLVVETQSNRVVVNGAERTINGLEFSWHQSLDFLPKPFNGLGVMTNYTRVDGRQSQPLFDPAILRSEYRLVPVGVLEDQDLTDQPKQIVNAQAYWEFWRINVRVAYQFVDRLKTNVGELRTVIERAQYQAPRRTVDASLRFRLTAQLQLFLDAKNLTREASTFIYDVVPDYPKKYQVVGRQWVAGVSGSF